MLDIRDPLVLSVLLKKDYSRYELTVKIGISAKKLAHTIRFCFSLDRHFPDRPIRAAVPTLCARLDYA